MSDRLSALLQRFELHARVVHSGALCGSADFDGSTGAGYLHLVQRGPLLLTDPHGRRSTVDEPSVVFIPRPGAHRLDGGDSPGTDVVCASIDFGAGDDNPLLRGLPFLLCVPLAQLTGWPRRGCVAADIPELFCCTALASMPLRRQRSATLALMPCDIATMATDAQGSSHAATTCAFIASTL